MNGGIVVVAHAGGTAHDASMQFAFVLYPRFTALDIVGPFQTLGELRGAEVRWVAAERGPVVDHTGHLSIVATHTFAETPAPDVVVVPGGMADQSIAPDDAVVAWLRAVHPTTTWTTSVCTGAIYLAHAGILDGLDATTHWAAYDRLRALGAHPTEQRVVERGKIVTAAGVSAGIDMGLTLAAKIAGETTAKAIQLAIEYDPQPPFDCGAPSKVPAELMAKVAAGLNRTA